jgi:hypothetical protein
MDSVSSAAGIPFTPGVTEQADIKVSSKTPQINRNAASLSMFGIPFPSFYGHATLSN